MKYEEKISGSTIVPNVTFKVKGIQIYDPRNGEFEITNNPALIMADLLQSGMIYSDLDTESEEFWDKIKVLADFCDEPLQSQ